MAFSVIPIKEVATDPINIAKPKNWWTGKYAVLMDDLSPGRRKVTNPDIHWKYFNMIIEVLIM